MAQAPPAKRFRKGTKSCVECRQRKVRCIWPYENAETCENCDSRGHKCQQQILSAAPQSLPSTTDPIRVTSQARIEHLERSVSKLWKAVHNLETDVGVSHTEVPNVTQHGLDTPHDEPTEDRSDIDSLESPTSPPIHILRLFENEMLSSAGHGSTLASRGVRQHASSCTILRRLLPTREDMLVIAARAASWLGLCNSLFPVIIVPTISDEMLAQYDKSQHSDEDPLQIAVLLLSAAFTLQQEPKEGTESGLKSIKDVPTFIKDVSDTVERVIVADDNLAPTLEGIEITLMFLRLQLGRARLRKMWLISRRVVALAELLGLPRASMIVEYHQEPTPDVTPSVPVMAISSQVKRKAELWDSICACDRVISMMWSLPIATAHYSVPKGPIMDSNGQIIPKSYLNHLASIASRIFELDNSHSMGRSFHELFDGVARTNQELRALAMNTPRTWWRTQSTEVSVDMLLQYWHQYLTARTHLQLALTYDQDQRCEVSFLACFNACKDLATRYTFLRRILPAGFFAGWVIDLQAFTAAIFLLLASYKTSNDANAHTPPYKDSDTKNLIEEVVKTMESATRRAEEDSIRLASNAIRSLNLLLQQPRTSDAQRMILNLPLVGRLHVTRKSNNTRIIPEQQNLIQDEQMQGSMLNQTPDAMATTGPVTSSIDNFGTLSYSMEIPDDFPFSTADTFGNEQWLELYNMH